jgi:predicted MPP superfamily phosphohydrolase
MDGFSIVQITDVHIGNTIGEAFVSTMVERVNKAKPDLIAITGDLVDGRLSSLAAAAEPLRDLRAKHGVFFVTGNHEYYSGVESWLPHLRTLGIRVLRNEREPIEVGGHGFDIAGVDDHSSNRWKGHGPDLQQAMRGRHPEREVVLLAHQPRQVHQAKKHDIGLQLSGHTHGGQIWPWHYLVKLQQGGLIGGLSRHGDTQLYVSKGTGYWGPPIRFLAKSEITRLRLRSQP